MVTLPSYATAINMKMPVADRTITGQVTSKSDGAGMPGVNILIKGSTNGTTTDADGRFTLNVASSDQVLIFSYIGYTSQELVVGNQSVFNISLEEGNETLQEVVVTALGIGKDKAKLGYSVGEVKGKDIVNVPQENVVNALAGRVAGVTINQTSGAGSSVSVIIRGATSLSNDNQPLFVIDGVPVSNGLNNTRSMGDRNNVDYGNAISDLNPDDIENISVLKGPSAAALYGSRAGNGVIMITTKSGKKGKGLGVTFSTSNVFETPYRFLDLHYKYANGSRPSTGLNQSSAYWGGPELDKGNTAVQWNSPIGPDGNPIATPLVSYKDNMKNFLQTGITSTNNVAISGSSDKAVYRVSYNFMGNQGLIPNSDLKRHSISASGEYQLHKSLKLSSNLNFTKNGSDNRPSTANRGANPLEAVYQYSNVNVLDLKDYWMPGAEHIQQRAASTSGDNPYFLAYAVNNGFKRDRVYGNMKLDWTISPKFSAFARVSHDEYKETRETKIPLSYSRGKNGGYYLQNISRQETNLDFLATYQERINDFDIRISGGANSMRISAADNYMGGATLTVPGLYRVSNIPVGALSVTNGSSEKAIYSLLGTATIGYKDMLNLDVAARNDWSSTLPATNRSYFYPSASLSWLVDRAFDLPQEITLLKLRASWARSGNDTSPYQLVPTMGTGTWGSLVTTNIPGTQLNSNLKPEIATAREFGVELNMYQNRLRLEATYYNMDNRNQILSITTPGSSGYSSKLINAGRLASKGFEFTLGTSPIRDRNGWNLDVNFNLTRNRTRILELVDGMDYFALWEDNGLSLIHISEPTRRS
jgi:TonB-linked SusC/RagA family outer membrane protein